MRWLVTAKMGRMVRMDWMGSLWDGGGGRTLAPTGTRSLPWATEQERHRWLLRDGALCEVVAGTNCVGGARTRIFVGESK